MTQRSVVKCSYFLHVEMSVYLYVPSKLEKQKYTIKKNQYIFKKEMVLKKQVIRFNYPQPQGQL